MRRTWAARTPSSSSSSNVHRYGLALCVGLLIAVVGYLSVSHASRVASLTRRIEALETQNKALEDERETRLARQRFEDARPLPPGRRGVEGPRPARAEPSRELKAAAAPLRYLLHAALAKSPAASGAAGTPFEQLRVAVRLDDVQERSVRSILNEFANAPGQAMAQAQAEKRFPFDARTVETVNDARRVALDRLRSVLTAEQYAIMLAQNLDEKLGLRVAPAARSDPPPR